jgi:aspartate aminotransferase/aminotransferase
MTFALVEEGVVVLIPDPGWPNYASIVALSRAHIVRYPLRPENGYIPDVGDVAARLTSRTKLLLLNNPGNPTGAVFPAETVEALVELGKRHELRIMSDEVYEALIFDGVHVPATRFDADGRVIAVSGCSKTYAMTGWRLGWAIADPALVAIAGKVQEALVSCPTAVSQRAAEAALLGSQVCVEEMRAAYHRRRDLVREVLEPAGLLSSVPRGAFYALVDLRVTGLDSRAAMRLLLEEERVATAPGATFGEVAEGMVRISLATAEDDLGEGCRRIRGFAERHAGALTSAGLALG